MGVVDTSTTAHAAPLNGWRAWAALVRFDRTISATLYVFLGAYLAEDFPALADGRVIRAALVVSLVVAFGFAINDCCDVPVDSIGRQNRPLPSGRISRRSAMRLAWALASGALAVASTLGAQLAAFAAATVSLAAAYSFWLKRTLLVGNACMALLVSAIPIYGALGTATLPPNVLAAAVMTFFYFCAQEILYNVEDFNEDRQAGLRTTAVRVGFPGALTLARLLLVVYAMAATAPWAIGIAGSSYLVAVLLCSVLPSLAVAVWLWCRVDLTTVRLAVKTTRAIWLSSVVPLLLLK